MKKEIMLHPFFENHVVQKLQNRHKIHIWKIILRNIPLKAEWDISRASVMLVELAQRKLQTIA